MINNTTHVLNGLPLIYLLRRNPMQHKGDAGKVILVGGAPGMAGALLLAAKACLHLGAGWTVLNMIDTTSATVCASQPELMIYPANLDRAQALLDNPPDVIAIGPGLGQSSLALRYLEVVLSNASYPIVVDADAINLIAQSPRLLEQLLERNCSYPLQSVLTPHPGEASRLLQTDVAYIQNNRLEAIHRLVEMTQSIIVLKGHNTLVASPLHPVQRCNAGNPGMATGGMGDVLTGSIAAIASQGIRHHLDLWDSTCIGTHLHSLAADELVTKGIGPIGLTPSELILEMRSILNRHL